MPERKRRGGAIDLHLKPPEEGLSGRITPLSLSFSCSPSACLSDLWRLRVQNESPAPSSLLALSPHSSTDTRSSHFLSHGPSLEFSAKKKKKEKREIEAEEEDEGVGSEVEEMSIYFPSLWPAWQDSFCHSHSQTCHFLPFSTQLCSSRNGGGRLSSGNKNSVSPTAATWTGTKTSRSLCRCLSRPTAIIRIPWHLIRGILIIVLRGMIPVGCKVGRAQNTIPPQTLKQANSNTSSHVKQHSL